MLFIVNTFIVYTTKLLSHLRRFQLFPLICGAMLSMPINRPPKHHSSRPEMERGQKYQDAASLV